MPELNPILEKGINAALSAEAVQAYINIATEYLTSLLTNRGFTEDEWREHYKTVIATERAEIQAELARLDAEELPS
jgi:hypothetical protein